MFQGQTGVTFVLLVSLFTLTSSQKCLDIHGLPLDRGVFNHWTCAKCYENLFPNKRLVASFPQYLFPKKNNISSEIPRYNSFILKIYDVEKVDDVCASLTEDECHRWLLCCDSARRCCDKQLQLPPLAKPHGRHCPRAWDGWGCWDDLLAGASAKHSCPSFILYSVPTRYAVKHCLRNTTKYRKGASEWTEYKTCQNRRSLFITVFLSLGCTAASLGALLPALFILCAFRELRIQQRIHVHINFLLSFVAYAVVHALWDVMIAYDKLTNPVHSMAVMVQNHAWCKLLTFIKIYLKGTNYMWLLCEGYYLHRLVNKGFKQPNKLTILYIIGWVSPIFPASIYSVLRLAYSDISCWVVHFGNYEWVICAPNLLCLVLNLLFLINILRVLANQKQGHPHEPTHFRRLIRAFFLLAPIFAVHIFTTMYTLPAWFPSGQVSYERFNIFITNTQGLFVAILICFLNSEVVSLMKQRSACCRRICSAGASSKRQNNLAVHVTFDMSENNGRADDKNNTHAQMESFLPKEDYQNNIEKANI